MKKPGRKVGSTTKLGIFLAPNFLQFIAGLVVVLLIFGMRRRRRRRLLTQMNNNLYHILDNLHQLLTFTLEKGNVCKSFFTARFNLTLEIFEKSPLIQKFPSNKISRYMLFVVWVVMQWTSPDSHPPQGVRCCQPLLVGQATVNGWHCNSCLDPAILLT